MEKCCHEDNEWIWMLLVNRENWILKEPLNQKKFIKAQLLTINREVQK